MAFTIPNELDAFNPNQAEIDSKDIDIMVAGALQTGVVAGCAVTQQGTPNVGVTVAAGAVVVAGIYATVAGGNLSLAAADATNPRFDFIVSNSSGTISAVTGTAIAEPVFPAIPANSVVLAAVYVPANETTILNNRITDKRIVLQNNLSGDPSLVASRLDLGNRSMSSAPTAGQVDNRIGLRLVGTGRFGLDNDNRGSLALLSLTGATGWSNGLKVVHTNTQASTDSAGIRVETNVSDGSGGAGVQVINDGYSDGAYIAARGPTGPATAFPIGLGVDVNRHASGTGERNSTHQGAGIAIDNFSTTNPGTTGSVCLSLRNINTSYNFPCLSIQSGLCGLQIGPWSDPAADTAGNVAFRIIGQTGYGTPRMVLTHGGWIGIGVNPPTVPLHVLSGLNNHIALRHTAAGGFAQIIFERSSDGTGRTSIGYDNTNDKGQLGNASVAVLTWDQNNDVTLNRDLSVGRDVAVTGKLSVTGQASFTGQPHANVYHNTTQNIPNAAETAVNFNSETTDVGAMHDNATNNNRLTVPTGGGGTYAISAGAEWVATAGGVRQIRIKKNGTTILATSNIFAVTAAAGAESNVSVSADLVATDYVEVLVYQDSGAGINLNGGAGVTWFAAAKIN